MENMRNYFKEKSTYFYLKLSKKYPINLFTPIAVILTILPLLVHTKGIQVDSDTADIYGLAVQVDLFSQYKASFLLYCSIILIVLSIIFFRKIFKKKDFIINLVLASAILFWILNLCSAIFSEHKNYAFYGAYDRAEGLITISCYMILFVYSIYTFKKADNYKFILIPVLILVVILSFLGIFQYTGHDLLNSKLGLFLVTGDSNSKLSLMYGTGKLYGTMYHYNYIGSFVAIVLPILVFMTIFQKRKIYKIIFLIGSLLSFWLLFGSTSRAGIIGVTVSFVLAIIIFWKVLLKKLRFILVILISIVILASGLNLVTNKAIFQKIPALISDSMSIFKDTSDFDYTKYTPVKDIKHINGHADVILQNDTIKISYENNNYVFRNSNDEIINYTENNRVFTTEDLNFKNISFNYTKVKSNTKLGYINLKINHTLTFVFRLGKDNTIHLVNPNSEKDIDIVHPDAIKLFTGKEKLGSARGYIWSRSIPLIKNNLLLGTGPDTFIYQFPQNDLIGKYYAYDTPNMIIDKPHNLYLQIILNDGVFALIAFLCIMLIYAFDSIRLYAFKKAYNNSQILGVATCLGIIGYLFAGIFNDSVISVAPIFWIVLGVGVSINFINRNNPNAL